MSFLFPVVFQIVEVFLVAAQRQQVPPSEIIKNSEKHRKLRKDPTLKFLRLPFGPQSAFNLAFYGRHDHAEKGVHSGLESLSRDRGRLDVRDAIPEANTKSSSAKF